MSTFNGSVQWQRAEGTPDKDLHLYNVDGTVGSPFGTQCTADQFSGSEADVCSPARLLSYAIATSHMFVFIELCGENAYSLKSYIDHPVAYVLLDGAVDKIVLTPKAFFEGMNVPDLATVRQLHEAASEKGPIEQLMKSKVDVRSM